MDTIPGGVCAPKGFTAAGVHCGVKANSSAEKRDLALIVSEAPCAAAGVFTRNRVKAAPVLVTMGHLQNGTAQAVIANSGNANACCPKSEENAKRMGALAAKAVGVALEDVVVASTGVIGQELNIAAIESGIPQAADLLSREGSDAAAQAIMTTDTKKKELAVRVSLGGKTVTLGAIAKGSGMIHPNMGTMLCFITTDCAIAAPLLQEALREAVSKSFNRVTVDGDTSTNDTCVVLANGLAGNPLIAEKGEDYGRFREALEELCVALARGIASDGEGASRLITCTVTGASDDHAAETLAKAVVGSSLVKAAMFGADANWGRVLCAMGYAQVPFRTDQVEVRFASAAGEVPVCRDGQGVDFDEAAAARILKEDEVVIRIALREGQGEATCWGCDLTYDYVKINGDYRT